MADMTVSITGSGFSATPTPGYSSGCHAGLAELLNQTYNINIPGDTCAETMDIHTEGPGWSSDCDNTWNERLPARLITEFGYTDYICAPLSPCAIKNLYNPMIHVKFGPAAAFQQTTGPTSITVTYEIPVLVEIERLKTKASNETIVYLVEDTIAITAFKDDINENNCTNISSVSLTLRQPRSPFPIDITSASVQVVSVSATP